MSELTKQETLITKVTTQTIEALLVKVIPTTNYFESQFKLLDEKIKGTNFRIDNLSKDTAIRFEQINDKLDNFKEETNRRFTEADRRMEEFKESVDKRFEQVDKRFEQVDKRFEQVDKRFEQVDNRFAKMDMELIQINETLRHINNNIMEMPKLIMQQGAEQRKYTFRMFTLSIGLSSVGFIGIFCNALGLF